MRVRLTGEAALLRALSLIRDHGGGGLKLTTRDPGRTVESILADPRQIGTDELQAVLARANVLISNIDADKRGREHFRGGDYRLLFYCLVGDHSLRTAIERAEEVFAAVNGRMGSLSLSAQDGMAIIDLGRRPRPGDLLSFTVSLHGLMNYYHILAWLIGTTIPAEARLDYPRSLADGIDPALLPFALQLDRRRNSMRFPAEFLDMPVIRTSADLKRMPSLNFIFGDQSPDAGGDLLGRARAILAQRLREREELGSLEQLAAKLQLSGVSLRRRLAANGTTFRRLRDETRRDLALTLLRNTALSIEDISRRADFCDADAFRRAVHGWTGHSPTAFRRVTNSGEDDAPNGRGAPLQDRAGSLAT